MNIVYLDHYAGGATYGRSFRPYYLGKEWIKKGHKLTVVGGTFSHLRNTQPDKAGAEEIEGIEYIWLKTPKYQGNGFGRIISMFVFTLQLFFNLRRIIRQSNPDIIIGSTVYMFDMLPAWVMKKLMRNKPKVVFELHDLWPLSVIELGGLKAYHPFIMLLKLAEYFAYKSTDYVVSILPDTYKHMKHFGIREDRFLYVPNGVFASDWENSEKTPASHQKIIDDLKSSGKFIVGYAGAHSVANAMKYLIDAAKNMQDLDSNIHFVLVGDGQDKQMLINYAEKLELNNITFLDRIQKQSIPDLLKQMDLLYIGFLNRELYNYGVSPNKIFDYMMASRPVIISLSSNDNLVSKSGCGITVEAEDAMQICEAILKLKNLSDKERNQMGEKGREYVISNHGYDYLADRFINFGSKQ